MALLYRPVGLKELELKAHNYLTQKNSRTQKHKTNTIDRTSNN